jgi:hypothetical protein
MGADIHFPTGTETIELQQQVARLQALLDSPLSNHPQ